MKFAERFSRIVLICLPALHSPAFAQADRPESLRSFDTLYWSWDPLVLGLLALSGALYLVGIRRLWRQSHADGGIRQWQAVCFWGG
jgi:putative membrane protein